ncbi:Hypothetical predicted protein [Mytilus galloprovincialis]|uniref:Reverse transcriptase domain-containing protein n=1 Tax=Mytilus galloprovincialis TaxID=29158 RepID=A0A8B6ECY9_MYTGA|nr:Hypothetical predicted protein [Mytilus galloprovincialis]
MNTPDNFIAGKIRNFLGCWKLLTQDNWILSLVKGYKIEFDTVPQQTKLPGTIKFNESEQSIINGEIEKFVLKNVVQKVNIQDINKQEFISNIFIRPKKDGSHRLILNLRQLNEQVEYHHFKMETLKTALQLIKPNVWFASADLKDAYFSVNVVHSDRQFLRFYWNGTKYQFTCLPNGLASAPRIFTKLLKPIFSTLRKNGYLNVAYIDDSLLISDTYQHCCDNIKDTCNLLDQCGFTIHPIKSVLYPCQEVTFLGFVINSITMTVKLTSEKAKTIVVMCKVFVKKWETTIREFSQLIGKLVASEPAVQYANFYVKPLEQKKDKALKINRGNYDAIMYLDCEIHKHLIWWINNIEKSSKPILTIEPSMILQSDSSKTGWGGLIKHPKLAMAKTGGHWSYHEQDKHINVLELLAAFLTLKSFCATKNNIHKKIYLDNTVAVQYINNMGGRKDELNELTRDIWNWCINRSIWLSACHLPGKTNVEADKLSRHLSDDMEWKLNENIFMKIQKLFGPSNIDLFASRLNCQLNKYVSYIPDPDACAIDAFSFSWNMYNGYAFPPFSIIGRVLQKVEEDKATLILIAPIFTTQPWFAKILHLIAGQSYILPKKNLLIHPSDPSRQHPLKKMQLAVFPLSGQDLTVLAYQQTLQTFYMTHGEIPQKSTS